MAYLDQVNYGGTLYDVNDTKGRAMIAPKEESSTASAAHAAGTYFTYNDLLYRATADIAVGGTITPGTNCVAVTVGAETRELKSAITDITGNTEIQFSDPALKQYINTNVSEGTAVSWDTPSVSSTTNIKWAAVECDPGDQFTISGKGGNSDRLWAWLDASKELIDKSASGATANGLVITAPANAAYLILNDETDKDSYIGVLAEMRISENENEISLIKSSVYADSDILLNKSSADWTIEDGYIANSNGKSASSGYRLCYMTAIKDFELYCDAATLSGSFALLVYIYNGSISAANYVTGYSRASSNLPTSSSKASVKKGQVLAVSVYTPVANPADFGIYANYKYVLFNNGNLLNTNQIAQVTDELIPGGVLDPEIELDDAQIIQTVSKIADAASPFVLLNKSSDRWTIEDGYYASTSGKAALANYRLCYLTAEKNFQFYFNPANTVPADGTMIVAIYNGSIAAANFVTKYTVSDSNIPNASNKGSVSAGQVLAVSVYTPESNAHDFAMYANIGMEYVLHSDVKLGNAQIDQVTSTMIETETQYTMLNSGSAAFTVEENTYANSYGKVSLSGYVLCSLVAERDFDCYFDPADTIPGSGTLYLAIYNNGEITQANFDRIYRLSDNNLPTSDNKASITAGQVIAVSVYSPSSNPHDFSLYANLTVNRKLLPDISVETRMENYPYGKKIAWFGDSVSELRQLPHITGGLLNATVYDCSIRGSTIGRTFSNYNEFSFYKLVDAVIAGDFDAQFDQLDAYEQAQGHTYPGIRENLTTLSTLDFDTIDYVVLLQGTNDFGINLYNVESDLAASTHKYVTNEYFVYQQQRYQATSTIEIGDAIVIGTNCVLSAYTKLNEMDGLMDEALGKFITAYPSIKFFILSPFFRGDKTEDEFGNTLAEFVDVEKENAEKYAMPFYNLLTHSRICEQNKLTYLNSVNDLVHPNAYGDAWIAELAAKFIAVN